MNNKKIFIGIIAILLLIGTGSFVFANQNNNESDLENDINYSVDSNSNSNSSNNSTNNTTSIDNTNNNTDNDSNNEDNSDSTINNSGNTNTGSDRNDNAASNSAANNHNNGSTNGSSSSNNSSHSNNSNSNNNNNNQNNSQNKPTVPEVIRDTTAPSLSISYSTDSLTRNSVIATIIANEEIKEVEDWNLSDDKKTLTKSFSSNARGTVTVSDLAGNTNSIPYNISNIDTTAPTANVGVEYTDDFIIVTITSNEKIKEVEGWTLKENVLTKTLPKNTIPGPYSLKIEDIAGNTTDIEYTIEDKIAPNLSISYSTNSLTRNSVTATITANEEIKVVEDWNLSDDKKTLTKSFSSNASGTVTVSDLAGNTNSIPYNISNIDTTSPSATVEVTKNGNNAIVTITANENIRAVEGWTLNGRVLTKEFKEFTSGTYNLTIYDLAGNSSTVNYELIDNKPPVLEVSYSNEELTKDAVTVIITANKPVKEVEGWTLSSDKKTLTQEFATNTSGEIVACDIEEHCSEPTPYEIKNIDNEAPTPTVTTSNNNGYKSTFRDIVVTITATEKIKEVEGWTLSDDKKTLTKAFKENKSDNLTIYDLAGNSANVPYEVKNYNPNRPEITVDKRENETTVTMVYLEPLDDTWELNENGEYTKVVVLPNEGNGEISITDKDGNVIIINSSLAPNLTVNISNKNEDGTTNKTNKPVEVKIISDKELKTLEGWTLSEDMKTLSKFEDKIKTNVVVTVEDLAGNTSTVKYDILNVDTIPPKIKTTSTAITGKANGDKILVTIKAEPSRVVNADWKYVSSGIFTKEYLKNDLSIGVEEYIELKDAFDNIGKELVTLKYTNGKFSATHEFIAD